MDEDVESLALALERRGEVNTLVWGELGLSIETYEILAKEAIKWFKESK